mmetsp:Transcript_25979/g.54671  ORF Transcript_25979/g.54671 Transcript_25979/m.54671 type:complete len:203 (+) Transcript_25979:1992-2600(+)
MRLGRANDLVVDGAGSIRLEELLQRGIGNRSLDKLRRRGQPGHGSSETARVVVARRNLFLGVDGRELLEMRSCQYKMVLGGRHQDHFEGGQARGALKSFALERMVRAARKNQNAIDRIRANPRDDSLEETTVCPGETILVFGRGATTRHGIPVDGTSTPRKSGQHHQYKRTPIQSDQATRKPDTPHRTGPNQNLRARSKIVP